MSLQPEIEYPDGNMETMVSDGTWKIFPDGPIRIADNFPGETYDAGKEVADRQSVSFDDSSWKNAVTKNNSFNIVPQTNQPVKSVETLEAKSVSKTRKGYHLFDTGTVRNKGFKDVYVICEVKSGTFRAIPEK